MCCWLHIDLADHGHQGRISEASIEPRELQGQLVWSTTLECPEGSE